MAEFYIQKGGDTARNLFSTYKIKVCEIKGIGLWDAEIKEPFKRDWKSSQGLDIWVPDKPKFADKDVEVTVEFESENKALWDSFMRYIILPNDNQYGIEPRDGVFQLWSGYQNTGARLRYESVKYDIDKIRDTRANILATLKFHCPAGLSYGITMGTGKTFTIKEGDYADFYYSDGTRDINKQGAFNKTGVDFCIINPKNLDSVSFV